MNPAPSFCFKIQVSSFPADTYIVKHTIPQLVRLIEKNLTDDLLKRERLREKQAMVESGVDVHPMTFHCFVATETLWQILGGPHGEWAMMQINHEGDSHWYLRGPQDEIVDITSAQFKTLPDYSLGIRKGPPTPKPGSPPSKRVRLLMERMGYMDHPRMEMA